jgi:hypothetical protein
VLAEIIASLYQSGAVSTGCAAAGCRIGIPQSRRGDSGRIEQAGRRLQTLGVQFEFDTRFDCSDGVAGWHRDRLPQTSNKLAADRNKLATELSVPLTMTSRLTGKIRA